jgi:diguanylate cyclase (GGDEF)-like protein/PAS domain S-box-containing protein
MPDTRILIVEDDAIIGRHIQTSLKRLGYGIAGVFSTGEEAVAQTSGLAPDLILMDISLAGALDGVDAAAAIHDQISIPIIFLTAYADPKTLQRARVTDPFGYMLKPFDERTLQITIEMALYKHRMERRLVESEELLRTLVENQGEGVAIFSPQGQFLFTNPAIEGIFGVPRGELVGKAIRDFTDQNQFLQVLGQMGSFRMGEKVIFETEILPLQGERRMISVTATPWIDKTGLFAGTFAITSDITERKRIEASERQARLLAEVLHTTAAALTSSLDIDQVFELILMNVGRVVPSDHIMIMMLEGDLARVVLSNEDIQRRAGKSIAWRDYPLFRSIIQSGQTLIVPEVPPLQEALPGEMSWLRSYLGAPLRIKGQVIGLINLGSTIPNFFKEYQASQLEAFALQAGLAIENARLYREAGQRAHFLEMLNEITRLAISAMDVKETMSAVAEKMRQLFNADGVYMTSWDEEQQLTIPITAFGFRSDSFLSIPYKPGELTLTASVLRRGHAIAVDDDRDTPFINHELVLNYVSRSMMGLPLISDGVRLGAVIIGFECKHHFTAEEIMKGEQVSSQVALAISKVRLYSQVQQMAMTDELTGLYNRRGIFEKCRLLLAESRKRNSPLSLIWLDIDLFKAVNDSYGHHIGDQVVRGVAECCKASVRSQDMIGRYGGEGGDELIIVLPDTDFATAKQVAERLRVRVAGQTYETDQGPIAVTVSQGIGGAAGDIDLAELLNRADQAMYAAKTAGRNCVVVAEAV